jgi:hypothetical protein
MRYNLVFYGYPLILYNLRRAILAIIYIVVAYQARKNLSNQNLNPKTDKKCRNCNHLLNGAFCSACGQKNTELNLGLIHFAKIALNEVVGYDTRLKTTFKYLFTQPGMITKRHNEGARNSFVQPMRLYLFISLMMFLSINLTGARVTSTTEGPAETVSVKIYKQPNIPLSFYFDITSDNSDVYNDKIKYIADTNRYPELNQEIVNGFSYAMFLLLPFFALFTKMLLLNKRRSYVEHLIFSIHFHVFIFIMATIAVYGNLFHVTSLWRSGFLFLYLTYLVTSLKNAYSLTLFRSIFTAVVIFFLHTAAFFYCQEVIKAFIVMNMA